MHCATRVFALLVFQARRFMLNKGLKLASFTRVLLIGWQNLGTIFGKKAEYQQNVGTGTPLLTHF